MRIAILGAGFMGSALTIPATDNGHSVALWGTHLDGHLVQAVRRGRAHPKLKLELPSSVEVFAAGELRAALAGADVVVNAVTSDGAVPVLRRAAPHIRPGTPVRALRRGARRGRPAPARPPSHRLRQPRRGARAPRRLLG